MSYGQNRNRHHNHETIVKRRLKTKPLLFLIGILFLGNLFWLIAWLTPNKAAGGSEEVANVDGKSITREEWMAEMESQLGEEALLSLVNERVMEAAAKKYKISIKDSEIDLEIALIRSAQDGSDKALQTMDDNQLREKIRTQLILEKVLTKDVIIENEEIEKFYEDNKGLYHIPTTYRTSIIVSASKEQADVVVNELENGSSFDVLAKERSLHRGSASLGGDIGFVTENQEGLDAVIINAATNTEANRWSSPIKLSDGNYVVVFVRDIAKGQSFSFNEVKEHIKRERALEQLPHSVTPEVYWSEFNSKWFYGK